MTVDIDGNRSPPSTMASEAMKPYLHPLRSASGKLVTRQYPMENVEGETRDHPHHQGLWFNHGDVNGFDFWGNVQSGTEIRAEWSSTKSQRRRAAKTAEPSRLKARWVDPNRKTLLKETRTMTFSGDGNNRIVDLDINADRLRRSRSSSAIPKKVPSRSASPTN